MAKKVLSVKPSINSKDYYFSLEEKNANLLNKPPLSPTYKSLRKAFKSTHQAPDAYYLLSRHWLRKWKESKEKSSLDRFNEDLLDFDKIVQGFEETDAFLKPGLIMNKDFIVIDLELQAFFESKSQGRRIKRYFQSITNDIHIYPKERPVVLITEDILNDCEFGQINEFTRKLIQIDPEITYEGLKRKYLNNFQEIIKNLDNPLKQTQIRFWKVSFSEIDAIFSDFKESCKKCLRNYCFYMKFGELIEETSQTPFLEPNEGLIIDFEEKESQFHLIKKCRQEISKCDYCSKLTISPVPCACKEITYCSSDCRQKDMDYHSKHCDKAKISEENEDFEINENSIKGLCGLENLGNTCYMNSALQCLSNCWDFSQYFIAKKFKNDLNLHNKLGSQGRMAEKYAEVLRNLWNGTRNVFVPSSLKSLISNNHFGEFSQEDSQEFLVFLLDMLHEDLNRGIQIYEKMAERDNPSASECWRHYLKRNNSIVVETFTGLFKSKIICPHCNKVSITFDPFLVCPVPIPQIKKKTIDLKIIKKEAHLPAETISYRFLSDSNCLSEMIKDVKSQFSLDFELFEWDEKNLSPITESFKMTNLIKKELKARQSSLLAFEKFRKDSPQILCLLFFYKIVASAGILSTSNKTNVSNFPRLLPLFSESHANPHKLYEAISLYLQVFLNEMEKNSELRKNTQEKPNNFFSKLFSNAKSSYPFKLVMKANNETLNPANTQNFSEKLIEIEVIWIEDPPKTFDCFTFDKNPIEIGLLPEKEQTKSSVSIYDCLQYFSKEERLDEKNQWKCPDCKNLQRAIKKMEIYQSPPILIIQLKRFKTNKSIQKSKIIDLVDFPVGTDMDLTNFVINHDLLERIIPETLPKAQEIDTQESMMSLNRYGRFLCSNHKIFHRVMPKKLDDNDDLLFEEDEIVTISTDNTFNKEKSSKMETDPLLYELIGVIEHKGNLGYGHYIAKCRNFITKKWHVFNDENVSEENESEILSNNAYILFYKRKKN